MLAKVKMFGYLVVGCLLCTAALASAASGSVIKTETSAKTYYQAASSGTFDFSPKVGQIGGELSCGSFTLSGTNEKETTSKLRLHPWFVNCTWIIGSFKPAVQVTVPASCDFELTLPAGESTVASWALVGCPVENPIKLQGYGCLVEVSNQSGLTGVTLTNAGSGKGRVINAQFAIKGLKTKQSAFGCGGGNGSFATSEFNASSTLTAFADPLLSSPVGTWVE